MDIQITQVDPSTGEVSLSFGIAPKKLRGVDKLAQKVVLKVLKNYGRDVFYPNEGTNFRNEIGVFTLSASGSDDEVRLLAVQRIQKIKEEIIAEQGAEIGDPTERIASLRVLDVVSDIGSATAAIRIQVTNEAGQQRDVVV